MSIFCIQEKKEGEGSDDEGAAAAKKSDSDSDEESDSEEEKVLVSVDLHLSKALIALDPDNLQRHCLLGLGTLLCIWKVLGSTPDRSTQNFFF